MSFCVFLGVHVGPKKTAGGGLGGRAQRLPPDALDVFASLGRERRQP